MPEKRRNAKTKCKKCKKVYDKKTKIKVCKCHSVSYCNEECQREDWPRHSDNCVPVMVKEYGEKGKGLVAAKNIKSGEQILTDKAVVCSDDIGEEIGRYLTSDAERLLINQKILKVISLLNHSCAPNAAMGLLDKENIEPEERIELRAIKDITKEEEVTICYPTENMVMPCLHAEMRKTILEDFGFDCKCLVCSGELPNQDDIMRKILDILISNRKRAKDEDEDEMTLSDWTKEAISFGAIVELSKPVYMGRVEAKMMDLWLLSRAAFKARKPALYKKTFIEINELAEKTRLKGFFMELELEIEMNKDGRRNF